ncbi:MAG: hypothetical protein R3B36_00970 [Polyangiaceae bacterium]
MRRRARTMVGIGVLAGVSALLAASCQGATQMQLRILTDLPCNQVRGVAIAAGSPPGSVENAAPATITQQCGANGEIGTLVLTPEQSKSSEIAIKVVMGVDRDVSNCGPDGAGCVIARRQLSYIPREAIELPIYMLLVCIGVPCDESSTCAANGKCVDKRISNPADCQGRGCFPDDDPAAQDAAPPVPSEAGWDGYTPPRDDAGNIIEAGPGDASSDGASDAADGGSDGGGGSDAGSTALWCPSTTDPQQVCPVGNRCCWKDPNGRCSAGPCAFDESTLECTTQQDCSGATPVCCTTTDVVVDDAGPKLPPRFPGPGPLPGGAGSACAPACGQPVCHNGTAPAQYPVVACPNAKPCNDAFAGPVLRCAP